MLILYRKTGDPRPKVEGSGLATRVQNFFSQHGPCPLECLETCTAVETLLPQENTMSFDITL